MTYSECNNIGTHEGEGWESSVSGRDPRAMLERGKGEVTILQVRRGENLQREERRRKLCKECQHCWRLKV